MNLKINCNLAEHTRYLCWAGCPSITDGQPTQHRHGTSRVVTSDWVPNKESGAFPRFFWCFYEFCIFFCVLYEFSIFASRVSVILSFALFSVESLWLRLYSYTVWMRYQWISQSKAHLFQKSDGKYHLSKQMRKKVRAAH